MLFRHDIRKRKGVGSMISRKGQEEIAGFVVVVLLISVIFVVFLGFSLNKKPIVQEKESREIAQFLESIRQTTSECSLSGDVPVNFKELTGACYDGIGCSDGKKACEVLDEMSSSLLEESYNVGLEAQIKGYLFSIDFEQKLFEEKKDNLINLSRGNCSSLSYREADDFFPHANGEIFTSMRVCY